MKKHLLQLLLAASLGLPTLTLAQNVFPTNGNVGIRTTAPTMPLDVNGTMRVRGNLSLDSGKYIIGAGDLHVASATNAPLYLNQDGGDVYVHVNSPAAASKFIVNRSRVGIGTLNPAAKLHVAGDTVIDLSANGGGRVLFANNPNDNKVYIEGLNSAGNDVAGEVVISGYQVRSLPKFSVVATVSAFSGKVSANTIELTSDRNQKQGFERVSAAEILAKVASLPVTTWAYTNSPNVRHLGPMAQDFQAAFHLGEDDKHIGAGDGIGVALAAIKGLHELVREKEARIAALERKLAAQEQAITDRLTALEQAVSKSNVQQASFRPEAAR